MHEDMKNPIARWIASDKSPLKSVVGSASFDPILPDASIIIKTSTNPNDAILASSFEFAAKMGSVQVASKDYLQVKSKEANKIFNLISADSAGGAGSFSACCWIKTKCLSEKGC